MAEGRDLAPAFELQVNGQTLTEGIARAITSVEYESADGVADMLKIHLTNVDRVLSSSKIFTAGNDVALFGGYGDRTPFIGGVKLVEPEYDFPENSTPTLIVKGYTADSSMMDSEPAKTADAQNRDQKNKRTWRDATASEILEEKATLYGMDLDVDDFSFGRSITQKAGMSDYELIKGLANIAGFVLWVDHDPIGTPTLHFKDPASLPALQAEAYKFRYDTGELSTLLSFTPSYTFRGFRTALKVVVRDPVSGKTYEEEVVDEAGQEVDTRFEGDIDDEVEDALPPPATAKIFVGDYSVTTLTRKRFASAAEVKAWAAAWFKRQRDNFIVGRGKVIGVETLAARQTHELEGLGRLFDGRYEFVRVRHVFDAGGYRCEFNGRKVL